MRPVRESAKLRCEGKLERDLRARGFHAIAGTDEAGRGSLFGPVFAAAVVLAPDRPVRGLNDSKLLAPERREALAVRIRERALAWAVVSVDASVVDRINIYQASRLGMKLAVESLCPRADFVISDAVFLNVTIPQQALIHGDARCHAIAAASILAKVHRDEAMREWDLVFPGYGLAQHKGYSTPEHLEALERLGPTPLHRATFLPVRSLLPDPQLNLFEQAGAV